MPCYERFPFSTPNSHRSIRIQFESFFVRKYHPPPVHIFDGTHKTNPFLPLCLCNERLLDSAKRVQVSAFQPAVNRHFAHLRRVQWKIHLLQQLPCGSLWVLFTSPNCVQPSPHVRVPAFHFRMQSRPRMKHLEIFGNTSGIQGRVKLYEISDS